MCSKVNTWSCEPPRTRIPTSSIASNFAWARVSRLGRGTSRTRRYCRKSFAGSAFQFFHELPEDSYEAFLSVPLMCRGRVVGAINLQHRLPHVYKRKEIRSISAIGFLVGAEIELARMEEVNSNLTDQLQTRKVVERAKGILQRELGLSEEQAYLALQKQSRQKRKAMREIAEAIILSEEVRETRAARASHSAFPSKASSFHP